MVVEVGAVVGWGVGLGEVDGVVLSASAHGDVDPFPVNAVAGDGVGTPSGGALGLVAGEGVAVVDVAIVEVPRR